MGTRNLTIVQLNGAYCVSQYGQWDGYPACMGAIVLDFLKTKDLSIFKNKLRNTRFITQDDYRNYWHEFGIDIEKEKFVDIGISNQFNWKHPTLSRNLGADILTEIYKSKDKLDLWDDLEFAKDSLMCEWAYVIDLDNNKLEVYAGFNKEKLDKESRFYFDGYVSDNGYYPIKLLKTYDIDNLPEKEVFVEELETMI